MSRPLRVTRATAEIKASRRATSKSPLPSQASQPRRRGMRRAGRAVTSDKRAFWPSSEACARSNVADMSAEAASACTALCADPDTGSDAAPSETGVATLSPARRDAKTGTSAPAASLRPFLASLSAIVFPYPARVAPIARAAQPHPAGLREVWLFAFLIARPALQL